MMSRLVAGVVAVFVAAVEVVSTVVPSRTTLTGSLTGLLSRMIPIESCRRPCPS